jgi:hypothetical protein
MDYRTEYSTRKLEEIDLLLSKYFGCKTEIAFRSNDDILIGELPDSSVRPDLINYRGLRNELDARFPAQSIMTVIIRSDLGRRRLTAALQHP